MSQNIKKGFLLSFIGVFAITFDTLLLRLLTEDLNLWTILFYRYIIYTLVSFSYNLKNLGLSIFREVYKTGRLGLACISTLTICNFCFIASVKNTNVYNLLMIYSTSPILTSIFSYITFRQKLFWWNIFTLFSATLTTILILYFNIDEETKFSKKENILGIYFAIGATVTTSIYFTIVKYSEIKYPENKMVLTTFSSGFLTSIISFILSMVVDRHDFYLHKMDILYLIIQGGIVLPVCYICVTDSLKYISSTESNLMFLLETILGPLWVYLGGFEKIPNLNILGIFLIVSFLSFNGIMTIKYGN